MKTLFSLLLFCFFFTISYSQGCKFIGATELQVLEQLPKEDYTYGGKHILENGHSFLLFGDLTMSDTKHYYYFDLTGKCEMVVIDTEGKNYDTWKDFFNTKCKKIDSEEWESEECSFLLTKYSEEGKDRLAIAIKRIKYN
jgi:hypothetical protein